MVSNQHDASLSETSGYSYCFQVGLKPRPHQQQCRSNIVECYKSNNSFDKVERCFDIVAGVDGLNTL